MPPPCKTYLHATKRGLLFVPYSSFIIIVIVGFVTLRCSLFLIWSQLLHEYRRLHALCLCLSQHSLSTRIQTCILNTKMALLQWIFLEDVEVEWEIFYLYLQTHTHSYFMSSQLFLRLAKLLGHCAIPDKANELSRNNVAN